MGNCPLHKELCARCHLRAVCNVAAQGSVEGRGGAAAKQCSQKATKGQCSQKVTKGSAPFPSAMATVTCTCASKCIEHAAPGADPRRGARPFKGGVELGGLLSAGDAPEISWRSLKPASC